MHSVLPTLLIRVVLVSLAVITRVAGQPESNEVGALMQIGQERLDRGDLVTAEQAYQRLSAMGGYPEVVGVGGLANIQMLMGRPEDSLALYKQHAQTAGTQEFRAEFNAMAAFLLVQQGRLTEARQELDPLERQFHGGEPLNARTMSMIAFTDRRLGELEAGLEAARRASEKFRAEANPRWTVMGRVAAGLLEDMGRELEASMEYEAQIAVKPDDAGTLSDFAGFLAVRGKQLDRALGYARRALELRPGGPGILDTLGFVLLRSGKLAEAADTLVLAWRLDPAATGVRTHLAQALAKGPRTAALTSLLDMLRTEPTGANTREIERLLAAVGR